MNPKSKALTVLFSFVPGAGHMYLGYLQKGIQLMTLFFFSIFLMAWLGLELLGFILPVIWFYSFFDALHYLEGGVSTETFTFDGLDFLKKNPRMIGWGLIILGCLVAFEQGLGALIPWEWRHYIQIGLVSLILVGGGIKLVLGSKAVPAGDEKEVSKCDNGE